MAEGRRAPGLIMIIQFNDARDDNGADIIVELFFE